MKRTTLAAFGLLLMAATSEAGILGPLQTGQISRLEDNDLESLLKTGSTSIQVGDLLLAVADFPSFEDALTNAPLGEFDATTPMIMAVSLIKVATRTYVGDDTLSVGVYTFEAPTAAEWLAATGVAGVAAGTTILVYEDPPSAPAEHLINTSIPATVAAATEGTLVYQFGFAGEGGEFQRATAVYMGGDSILALDSLSFFAAYNLTAASGPGAIELGKFDYLGSTASPLTPVQRALFTAPTHIQLQGAQGTIATGGWQLATDTDAYLLGSAVPEPASMLLWTGLAAFAGLRGYRRRKTSAAV